jgi:hypothetical protein
LFVTKVEPAYLRVAPLMIAVLAVKTSPLFTNQHLMVDTKT